MCRQGIPLISVALQCSLYRFWCSRNFLCQAPVFPERNMASFKGGNKHGVAHLDNVSGSQMSVGVGFIHQSKDVNMIMLSNVWCDTTQDKRVNSPPLYDLVSVTVSTATDAKVFYRLFVKTRLIL